MNDEKCIIVILTFNSVQIINETIQQALKVSPKIFVLDSGSTDGTLQLLEKYNCQIISRAFINYSNQRNWAIDQVSNYAWQLHLDADEVLDDIAISQIKSVLQSESTYNAYMLKRRDYFMGKMLRFSGLNPWHLRLFKSGFGRCENRLYDQHFIAECKVGRLKGLMHDKNMQSLSEWIERHNRWSNLEALEIATKKDNQTQVLEAKIFGDGRERARAFKLIYYKIPDIYRSVLYYLYRYFIRFGFLDGVAGFYFIFFQALWFRMLVDAKASEILTKKIKN